MSAKTTPWYPGDVVPSRCGVYERVAFGDPVFSFWDGYLWHRNSWSAHHAAASRIVSNSQDLCWRGLAQPVSNPDELKP